MTISDTILGKDGREFEIIGKDVVMMRFNPGQLERQMWQRLRRFKAQEERLKTRQSQLADSPGFKGWLCRLGLSTGVFVIQRQIRNHQQVISRLQR